MPTITGTLQTFIDDEANPGSIEVALCGYGSQVPRLQGEGIASRVTDDSPEVGDDGTFSFDVPGNDEISPEGTYYTVTVKDDNGDIVQVNAYQFASTQTDYDLNQTVPFDPSQAMPPAVPPLILDLLEIVSYSPAAVFSGDVYSAWQITLTGDCAPTFENVVDGNLYTVIVIQDASGGHAFNWPSNVNNATPVSPAADDITIQTFVAVEGDLYAIAPATYYQ
jgi:hypothetical protein